MTTRYRRLTVTISIVALLLAAAPAWAFDAEQTFKKGTFVLSGEGAYGWQTNLERKRALRRAITFGRCWTVCASSWAISHCPGAESGRYWCSPK